MRNTGRPEHATASKSFVLGRALEATMQSQSFYKMESLSNEKAPARRIKLLYIAEADRIYIFAGG